MEEINQTDLDLQADKEIESSLIFLKDNILKRNKIQKLKKLRIVKLDSISIPPSSLNTTASSQIDCDKMESTFPASEYVLQTSSLTENQVEMPIKKNSNLDVEEPNFQPQSDPTSDSINHNLFLPHEAADLELKNMRIGDGIEYNNELVNFNEDEEEKEEELCVIDDVKSVDMEAMPEPPTVVCKRSLRSQTQAKLVQKKRQIRTSNDSSKVKSENVIKKSKSVTENITYKTDGNQLKKLSAFVDQLQSDDWEICHKALKNIMAMANSINWECDMYSDFVRIINRKLNDFLKSPRTNLVRTACQFAGDFFIFTKCTKRPEFDDMVNILMCKTADQNRFIQKNSTEALDKMIVVIPIQHSTRAICSTAPDSKNSIVRATVARLLLDICTQNGIEAIVGAEANAVTRTRVLKYLAKFLVDKNIETRRYAECLCKMLKSHNLFIEYFFKDVANNMKKPLRQIINNIN